MAKQRRLIGLLRRRGHLAREVLLAANVLIPLEVFLGGGVWIRYVAPCALVMAPIAVLIWILSWKTRVFSH